MTSKLVSAQIACVLLLACCVPYATAQRGGGPGRDLFFEALRELHREVPNKELFDLLEHPTIREAVHLSDADAAAIRENIHQAIRHVLKLRDERRGESIAKEELKLEILKTVAPFDKASYELLKKSPEDFERLLGLYAQARNHRAALNQHVADKIGLTEAQLAALREAHSSKWRDILHELRDDMDRELRHLEAGHGDPRKAMAKLFERANEKLDGELAELLTAEQRAKLEELKGEKFNLPDPLFYFDGRSRGPRGDGDKRGGGPTGAGDKRDEGQHGTGAGPCSSDCSSNPNTAGAAAL